MPGPGCQCQPGAGEDSGSACSDESGDGSDVEGLDGLEGLQAAAAFPEAPRAREGRRSADAFRAFLCDAAGGGARMHLAEFWDGFYATHPCIDEGFAWYAQWRDVEKLLPAALSPQGAAVRVLLSGVGDDARLCTDLTAAGYGSVTGVDFSLPALYQCQR